MMIVLLWILNFGISVFNALGCGNTWDSTRARGGLAHFMNWMAAIMSASGFTWCYLVILGLLGAVTPLALFMKGENGVPVEGMLLDAQAVQAFFDLGYLVILLPILGSGLAITVNSWREFARAKHRRMGDYVITGWNTFAQIDNIYMAIQETPGVITNLGRFFFGGAKDSDAKGKAAMLVVTLVVVAALGGVLTTFSIIQVRRRAVILNEYNRAILAG